MKRITALALCAALLMCAPASALSEPPGEPVSRPEDATGSAPISGVALLPYLNFTLPTFDADSLHFDPYNQSGQGKQIQSALFTVQNNSTVPMEVFLQSYTAYTTSPSGIVSVTDPALVEADTGKNLLLWLGAAEKEDGHIRLDGNGVPLFSPYRQSHDSGKVMTGFGAGHPGSPQTPLQSYGVMLRGQAAQWNPRDGLTKSVIDGAVLGSRSTVVLRFDGAMNTQATWDSDEGIYITPVFTCVPLPLDTSEEYPPPKGASLTPESDLVLHVPQIVAMSGQTFTLGCSEPLKMGNPLPPARYTLSITSADGNTQRVINTSRTQITFAATASGCTLTVRVRAAGCQPGDVLALRLKAEAFRDPALGDSQAFTATLHP